MAALATVLTACATPVAAPDRSARLDVPPAWHQPAPPADPRATRDALTDPLLDVLVREAIDANPSIASAKARLAQARALREVTIAATVPSVGATTSAQAGRSGGANSHQVKAGLDASWEWDLFGGQRASVEARSADAEAAQASLGDAQVSVAAEVRLAYIQVRAAQQRLALAQANLAAQRETLQIAQWRAQAGLGSSLDVEQARTAALQTEAQLPQYATTIAQSGHALAVLTGRAPATLSERLASPLPIPSAPGDIGLTVPADTLRQRPDVRAAEWSVRAATARVAQAEADRLPAFRLNGSIALSGATLGALSGGGSFASALLASIDLPLVDGGAGAANVRAQQAGVDEARSAYRGTVLTALKDVEDALVALADGRQRLAALQGAAEAAAHAALLARQRYASGLVDFQTVLDTQRSQLTAQDSVAAAQADLATGHVRLVKALGGGWPTEAASPSSGPDRP